MSLVDQAFVKAIATIKGLSRSHGGQIRPPEENRSTLYGLYKQATEGDVVGVLPRPVGSSLQDEANKRKWDAWHAQAGLTRTEAKIKYIEHLLETMRSVLPPTPEAQRQLAELEAICTVVRRNAADLSEPSYAASFGSGYTLSGVAPSYTSTNSAYGQFLPRPTYSEFGLSERMSDMAPMEATPIGGMPEDSSIPFWRRGNLLRLPSIGDDSAVGRSLRERYLRSGSSKRGRSSDSGDDVGWTYFACIEKFARALVRIVLETLRRVLVDSMVLVVFLFIVRLVRTRPHLLSRLPYTRQIVSALGDVFRFALDELGLDIKSVRF